MLRFLVWIACLIGSYSFRYGFPFSPSALHSGLSRRYAYGADRPYRGREWNLNRNWPGRLPKQVPNQQDVETNKHAKVNAIVDRFSAVHKAEAEKWPGRDPATEKAFEKLKSPNKEEVEEKHAYGSGEADSTVLSAHVASSAPATYSPSNLAAGANSRSASSTPARITVPAASSFGKSSTNITPLRTPTTTSASTRVNTRANTADSKEAAEMASLLAAMQMFQRPTRRLEDDPAFKNIEDGYELVGPISPTFRSGFVSILGNANVGKSTLLNYLLQQDLCIVSPKPQTTRHSIFGIVTRMPEGYDASTQSIKGVKIDTDPNSWAANTPLPITAANLTASNKSATMPTLEEFQQDGYQLVVADTPGMLVPVYKLQEVMLSTVRTAERQGDVVLLVTDVYGEPLHDTTILTKLQSTTRPVIIAINKVDLAANSSSTPNGVSTRLDVKYNANMTKADKEEAEYQAYLAQVEMVTNRIDARVAIKKMYSKPQTYESLRQLWQSRLPKAQIVGISAKHGTNVPTLLHTLLQHVPYGPLYYPESHVADRNERFFTTEIIRECLLELYQDEIPYSCEVVIEEFQDKGEGFSIVDAAIVVSRKSQKGIIIGTKGKKLGELGRLARAKLEKFLDRKVYLRLRVKVDEEWRSNKDSLKKYGYIEGK